MKSFLLCNLCSKKPGLSSWKKITEGRLLVNVKCACGAEDTLKILEDDFLAWASVPEIAEAFRSSEKKNPAKEKHLW